MILEDFAYLNLTNWTVSSNAIMGINGDKKFDGGYIEVEILVDKEIFTIQKIKQNNDVYFDVKKTNIGNEADNHSKTNSIVKNKNNNKNNTAGVKDFLDGKENKNIERERQQLAEERRKFEEEKRSREQARNNQRLSLQVTNTQANSEVTKFLVVDISLVPKGRIELPTY